MGDWEGIQNGGTPKKKASILLHDKTPAGVYCSQLSRIAEIAEIFLFLNFDTE